MTEAHAARIKGLVEGTKGKIEFGGEVNVAEKYVAPTVVSDVRGDDSLMSE